MQVSLPVYLVKETLSHSEKAKELASGWELAKAGLDFPSDAAARSRRQSLLPALRSAPEVFPNQVS